MPVTPDAGLLGQQALSLALAQRLVRGAQDEAADRGVPMAIVVVDRAGVPIAASRMDGTTFASWQLAFDKAFTAAAFGSPTEGWMAPTQPGGADWGMTSALGGRIIAMGGGVPVRHAGELVGGLGVSGGAPAIDAACARAGLRAGTGLVDAIDAPA